MGEFIKKYSFSKYTDIKNLKNLYIHVSIWPCMFVSTCIIHLFLLVNDSVKLEDDDGTWSFSKGLTESSYYKKQTVQSGL